MLIIGERINSSRKQIAEAIRSGDRVFIEHEVRIQAEAGADYIEVNAGTFGKEEAERLQWVIEVVQSVTKLPLCVDSPDPQVIQKVLSLVQGRPIINSITLEPFRLEGMLPLVVDYKAKVIGLCQSEESMADTKEAKVEMAGRLVEEVKKRGIALNDLYIDPLVYPIGTDSKSALATLGAIEEIMRRFPGIHTTCGLTNVSHGLPNRKLINRTFLTAAIIRGLDSAILDPSDKQLYGSLKAAQMIAGEDEFCMEYLRSFREGRFE